MNELVEALAALRAAGDTVNRAFREYMTRSTPDERKAALARAAYASYQESVKLFELAAGETMRVHPLLDDLRVAVDRARDAVSKSINERFAVPATVRYEEVEDLLFNRELASSTLEHAELKAIAALLQMTEALRLILADDSTNG